MSSFTPQAALTCWHLHVGLSSVWLVAAAGSLGPGRPAPPWLLTVVARGRCLPAGLCLMPCLWRPSARCLTFSSRCLLLLLIRGFISSPPPSQRPECLLDREQHTAARRSGDETGCSKFQIYWAGSDHTQMSFPGPRRDPLSVWALNYRSVGRKRSKGNTRAISLFPLRHPATQSSFSNCFGFAMPNFPHKPHQRGAESFGDESWM